MIPGSKGYAFHDCMKCVAIRRYRGIIRTAVTVREQDSFVTAVFFVFEQENVQRERCFFDFLLIDSLYTDWYNRHMEYSEFRV